MYDLCSMWNNTDAPIAYFISFRTYGTWLHGDERGSIDLHNNIYGNPKNAPNKHWPFAVADGDFLGTDETAPPATAGGSDTLCPSGVHRSFVRRGAFA